VTCPEPTSVTLADTALETDLVDAHGRIVPVLIGCRLWRWTEITSPHLTCLTFTDVSAQKAQDREIARLGSTTPAARRPSVVAELLTGRTVPGAVQPSRGRVR
jgi:hypothetical protein